jgi:hypothetical protein
MLCPRFSKQAADPIVNTCLVLSRSRTTIQGAGKQIDDVKAHLCDASRLTVSRDDALQHSTQHAKQVLVASTDNSLDMRRNPCSYPQLLIIDFALCPIAAPRVDVKSHALAVRGAAVPLLSAPSRHGPWVIARAVSTRPCGEASLRMQMTLLDAQERVDKCYSGMIGRFVLQMRWCVAEQCGACRRGPRACPASRFSVLHIELLDRAGRLQYYTVLHIVRGRLWLCALVGLHDAHHEHNVYDNLHVLIRIHRTFNGASSYAKIREQTTSVAQFP